MLHQFFRLSVFVFALACQVGFVSGQSKLAKIDELLQVSHVDRIQDAFIRQMAARNAPVVPTGTYSQKARAAAEALSQQLNALLLKAMNWEKTRPEYAKAYDEVFTESEISSMLSFYKSPAGQAMLDKMPLLLSSVQTRIAAQISGDAGLKAEVERLAKEALEKSK